MDLLNDFLGKSPAQSARDRALACLHEAQELVNKSRENDRRASELLHEAELLAGDMLKQYAVAKAERARAEKGDLSI